MHNPNPPSQPRSGISQFVNVFRSPLLNRNTRNRNGSDATSNSSSNTTSQSVTTIDESSRNHRVDSHVSFDVEENKIHFKDSQSVVDSAKDFHAKYIQSRLDATAAAATAASTSTGRASSSTPSKLKNFVGAATVKKIIDISSKQSNNNSTANTTASPYAAPSTASSGFVASTHPTQVFETLLKKLESNEQIMIKIQSIYSDNKESLLTQADYMRSRLVSCIKCNKALLTKAKKKHDDSKKLADKLTKLVSQVKEMQAFYDEITSLKSYQDSSYVPWAIRQQQQTNAAANAAMESKYFYDKHETEKRFKKLNKAKKFSLMCLVFHSKETDTYSSLISGSEKALKSYHDTLERLGVNSMYPACFTYNVRADHFEDDEDEEPHDSDESDEENDQDHQKQQSKESTSASIPANQSIASNANVKNPNTSKPNIDDDDDEQTNDTIELDENLSVDDKFSINNDDHSDISSEDVPIQSNVPFASNPSTEITTTIETNKTSNNQDENNRKAKTMEKKRRKNKSHDLLNSSDEEEMLSPGDPNSGQGKRSSRKSQTPLKKYINFGQLLIEDYDHQLCADCSIVCSMANDSCLQLRTIYQQSFDAAKMIQAIDKEKEKLLQARSLVHEFYPVTARDSSDHP